MVSFALPPTPMMSASSRARTAVLLALAGGALLKVGALLVCPAGRCHSLAIDTHLLGLLHGLRTPALDVFFEGVTWAGSLWVLAPLALLMAALDRRAATLWQRAFMPLALLSQWPLVHLAKFLIERPRPTLFEALIAVPADASFPSAHTAQITAFACAWLLRPGQRVSAPLAAAALLTVTSVAASRLYLQVHYPSDVLFGMLAALLWVLALRHAIEALEARA